ncbi:MAG: alanine--glyoxylate aminotransferase family protein [Candidatus Omnitrophota bacterium]
MAKKCYLMTPGPTPVPEEIMLEMAKPIIHHRTPQFTEVIKKCEEGLKCVLKTKNEVVIFTSSGTGAMEASIVNFLSAGDKAICVIGGKFGERWSEICKAYGVNSIDINVEWNKVVDPDIIKKELEKNPDVKAVFTTQCETSSGSLTDIEGIAKIVSQSKAILVVDAISSLGACELKTDDWKVDVVVSGSQKGLMIPPGLAFCSVSEKAKKMLETSTLPKFYFNIKKALKTLEKNDTPWTPAITLMIGLAKALEMIQKEGIDEVIKRHNRLASAVRGAVKALKLELLSESPANAVTAVKVPEGIDGEALVKNIKNNKGVWFAGGQGYLKGKIFRIATLGFMQEFDVIISISALELGLREGGYKFEMGLGVKAVLNAFSV